MRADSTTLPSSIEMATLRHLSSKPAVFNINCRQDVAGLCMDPDEPSPVAAERAARARTMKPEAKELVKKTLTVQTFRDPPPPTAAAPSLQPPPAFSASPVPRSPISFAPPQTLSSPPLQLKSGGHWRSGPMMCGDCEPPQGFSLFSNQCVGGGSWASLL